MNVSGSNLADAQKMLREMAAEAQDLKSAAGGSVTDVVAAWLAPQYLLAVREQLAALPAGPEQFKLLRLAVGDVFALQRGGTSAARLQLDREKLELDRQKHRDAVAAAQQEIQKLRDVKAPMSDRIAWRSSTKSMRSWASRREPINGRYFASVEPRQPRLSAGVPERRLGNLSG